MNNFVYKNDTLYCEDVSLLSIAENHNTHFYCYSQMHLENQYQRLTQIFKGRQHLICYAMKANSNLAILKILSALGAGADTVSANEIRKALSAGIPAEKIIFSGVGKSEEEIVYALNQHIKQIHVESISELELINRIAIQKGIIADITIRINPDIVASTHKKIATGSSTDKFGIEIIQANSIIKKLDLYKGINIVGVSVHIGSQITSLAPFQQAFTAIVMLAKEWMHRGVKIKNIDFGGGIGIRYQDEPTIDIQEYVDLIIQLTDGMDIEIILEPGRYIVGNAGALVSKVLYMKENSTARKIAIINAGMSDFLRPALYDARHSIIPVVRNGQQDVYDIVGPICESSDVFARDIRMGDIKVGDYIAIMGTGAYGSVLANNYNMRTKIPEFLISKDRYAMISKKQTYEELIAQEIIPAWL